jgi:TfoX/Sxy family transcriptional regulator of competence genes
MTAELADRIRAVVKDHPNIGEIRMFGGLCFTLNGNMLVGTMKNGDLMARVGEAQDAEAHSKPGAGPMMFTGKAMKGFVTVSGDALDDAALRDWISMSMAYVGTMPAKEKKKPKDK